MIRLTRFFENVFDDTEISDDKLRAFGSDRLPRLIANNHDCLYDALIAFHGKVASKARTAATKALMEEIKGKWNRREGRSRDVFGDGTADYLGFYPQRISEYRNATMEEMGTLLTRYSTLATQHLAELAKPFADEWTGYQTKWTAVRGAQLTQKGSASSANEASATARATLEVQLQANVLTVALHQIGQPERAAAFFNQSLLENPATPAAPPAP